MNAANHKSQDAKCQTKQKSKLNIRSLVWDFYGLWSLEFGLLAL
jgi:hypothetical protein